MVMFYVWLVLFFFKQKTAYEMRISDWSSDVCSSDLLLAKLAQGHRALVRLPPADDQQIGHFGQAVFAHLVVDLLVAEVGFRPDSRGAQLFRHLACIAVRIGHDGDRKSTRLNSSH